MLLGLQELECLDDDGFVVLPGRSEWVSAAELIAERLPQDGRSAGVRNLLGDGDVQGLAAQIGNGLSAEPLYGVRALWFDKGPGSNWKVPWHQDVAIAVAARTEAEEFGPWSVKRGVHHVQPPAALLGGMLSVRLHLDAADEGNGGLRVVPGSHCRGVLSPDQIAETSGDGYKVDAERGDLIVMRPLLLHASSCAAAPRSRRVLHIEYSSDSAPAPLAWRWRVDCSVGSVAPRC